MRPFRVLYAFMEIAPTAWNEWRSRRIVPNRVRDTRTRYLYRTNLPDARLIRDFHSRRNCQLTEAGKGNRSNRPDLRVEYLGFST